MAKKIGTAPKGFTTENKAPKAAKNNSIITAWFGKQRHKVS
jgi:hypothetical protein